MRRDPPTTILDRAAMAAIGGLTGAAWGLVIAGGIFLFRSQWPIGLVGWSAAVFAVIGLFAGDVVLEAALAWIHFLWGLLAVLAEDGRLLGHGDAGGHLRAFLLLGAGTGIVLMLWSLA